MPRVIPLSLYDHCRQGWRGENLDPVAIRVLDERQPLHFAVVRPFHKLHTHCLEAGAGCINVGNGNADVAETTWLSVTIVMAGEVGVSLSSPIMCQLQGCLLPEDVLSAP